MDAKKIIFLFFVFTLFLGGSASSANVATIYTQPYQRDARGNLIPAGVGSDGLPRFREQCGPCAELDRALYERDRSGNIVRSLIDLGDTVIVTESMPADMSITSIPTLVSPDGRQTMGPNAILSRTQAIIQQVSEPKLPVVTPSPKPRLANQPDPRVPNPKDAPPRRNQPSSPVNPTAPNNSSFSGEEIVSCAPALDSGRYAYRCITKSGQRRVFVYTNPQDPGYIFFKTNVDKPLYMDSTGHAQLVPAPAQQKPQQPAVKPRQSELPDTLPPVPGDPGYVPSNPRSMPIPSNDGWIPIPRPNTDGANATRNGDHFIVTLPDGSQFKVTMQEVTDFYRNARSRADIDKEPKDAAIAIITRGLGGKPMAPTKPPVATPPPKKVSDSDIPVSSASYFFKIDSSTGRMYKYAIEKPYRDPDGNWVVQWTRCELKSISCSPTAAIELDGEVFSTPEAAQAAAAVQINQKNMAKPFKRGATATPNAPPPGGAVKDPFADLPVKGTPLTPAQAAEAARQLAEEEAEQARLKAQINALPKAKP